MLMRTAIFAAAAALFSAPALADTPDSREGCQETSFRIYFSQDSAELDATSARMLDIAARQVAACGYRELHVALDPSSPNARERAAAITAIAGANWNATRIEARQPPRDGADVAGPEFAEVVMTPHPSTTPARPLTTPGEIGV